MLQKVHHRVIHSRRVRSLAQAIAPTLPLKAKVLDVGCGDGQLGRLLQERRPDITIVGIDTLVRPDTALTVTQYDGVHIPFNDRQFDVALLVDVLHHTPNPFTVLRETVRVAKRVVIKDHRMGRPWAGIQLYLMDIAGNAAYGVRIPCQYWPESTWRNAFNKLGAKVASWHTSLDLYWGPMKLLFEYGLHYLAVLDTPTQLSQFDDTNEAWKLARSRLGRGLLFPRLAAWASRFFYLRLFSRRLDAVHTMRTLDSQRYEHWVAEERRSA